MATTKRRKITKNELERNTLQFSNVNAPKKTFTVIDNGRKAIRTQTLPRISPSVASGSPAPPPMVPALSDISHSDLSNEDHDADFAEDTRTQRAKLLEEYADIFEPAAQLIMQKEADPRIGMPCSCNEALREVRCLECKQFTPLCRSCWVRVHRNQPLHWAHVWNGVRGYFQRHDISTVLGPDSYGIPLGHEGDACPRASKPLHMTLVDNETGVHATKVVFCGCCDSNKWRQLMDADFFPATLMTLQSKITAYDYIRALRRKTDNVFTGNVPDVYKQFQFVSRIWPLLEAEKRFGRLHGNGMNELYPRRPTNNLMVYCPACPEADVNIEPGWEKTPPHLMHLHTIYDTIDGNSKTGNYEKNNDPNDVSLFAGRAYMPEQKRHDHYLQTVPQLQKEKATCNHLKVENGANRAKFKNMSVTGNVNVQCSHILVCSSVDMKGGENHATVDLGVKLRVESCRFDKDNRPPRVFSYDNMCSLAVHIVKRWRLYHKDDADVVEKARWTIPACHVKNHHEGCDYLYCYMYKMCMGHFHGETAEYGWAIFNAIGPSVLQMSNGHRIDTLIMHYGDWNWRKVVGLARQLLKDLNDAKVKYVEKRDFFAGLCVLFESKVVEWNAMDRSPCVDPKSKRSVVSIYSHNNQKAPTLKAIVDKEMSSSDTICVSSGNVKLGAVASWLLEGLRLFQIQHRVFKLASTCSSAPPKSLTSQRSKLAADIDVWRKMQKRYMGSIGSRLSQEPDKQHPEEQSLLLPSDFTAAERGALRLLPLATKQVQMLEAALGETISNLQTTVKNLSSAFERKIKDARGQDANTKSIAGIRKIESKRNDLMGDYNLFRGALKALDNLDEAKWPPLELKDTFRKSTEQRRTPGDSRVVEGNLWGMTSAGHSSWAARTASGAISGYDVVQRSTEGSGEEQSGEGLGEEPVFNVNVLNYHGTHMSLRQARSVTQSEAQVTSVFEPTKEVLEHADQPGVDADGWIWSAGRMKNMSMQEIEQWEQINNRIQWARAEADFERWQEEVEKKHAEFMRVINASAYARDAWMELARTPYSSSPGHVAYAKEHCDILEALRADAEAKYSQCGIPSLRIISEGFSLADHVMKWRQEEEKHFNFDRWANRPMFKDPTTHAQGFGDVRVPVSSEDSIQVESSKRNHSMI
ncbi:hypothetical protein C8R42DRAFT_724415 [Lentinula raphanica]|nr:hypothetical protein C8R42DRAFT_724415 [Lentinula raphanica]